MPRSRAPNIIALTLAVILAAASCWTVIPAPNLPTLILAVAIPEITPVAFPIAVLATLLIARLATQRTRTLALSVAVFADACLAWPLAAYPFARQAANAALTAGGIPPAAATANAAVDVVRDLPVRLRDGSALALDLYHPHLDGPRPLLAIVYGGAWQFGSRSREASLARRYAAQGYAVAALEYRHAPQSRFPTQLHDVEDALQTLAANARAWRIDPRRVALLGQSAGAQLVLLAAERPQPLGIRAVIGYYAPVDLAGGWETPPRPDPANVRAILETYLGGPPDAAHRALYDAAAPLANAHAGMPPVLLMLGDRDELVLPRFQQAFAARLRERGVPVIAFELPWANHAFDLVRGLGAGIGHDAVTRVLQARLTR